MAWREGSLDVILVPASVAILVFYHSFLIHKFKTQPMQTVVGVSNRARRAWVRTIMKDIEKKNILAVQTIRNSIMASTLMASTAILLSTGLAAFLSSSYSVKKPLQSGIYGAHDEFTLSVKFISILACFVFSFLCYTQSIRFMNHVNYLINVQPAECAGVTPEFVGDVLSRSFAFYSIGTRVFYMAVPLLFWIYGPIPVALCSIVLVPILYQLDIVKDFVPSDSNHKLAMLA